MKPDNKTLLLPMLLIVVGAGWLLTTLDVVPGIDWVWTLGLAAVGLLTFAVGGFDKVTVVIGPFFILASGLSVLRQTDRLQLDVEAPILVIISGILLLVARTPVIPVPKWAGNGNTHACRHHQSLTDSCSIRGLRSQCNSMQLDRRPIAPGGDRHPHWSLRRERKSHMDEASKPYRDE